MKVEKKSELIGRGGAYRRPVINVQSVNDVHTTKSRTRVILFSESIGAF
jgi:hypothetical protein